MYFAVVRFKKGSLQELISGITSSCRKISLNAFSLLISFLLFFANFGRKFFFFSFGYREVGNEMEEVPITLQGGDYLFTWVWLKYTDFANGLRCIRSMAREKNNFHFYRSVKPTIDVQTKT